MKAQRVMLESCLQLSSTLLEYWEPDGSRRRGSSSSDDDKVKEDIEDFFTTAKCTKFDDDIQVYADEGRRRGK